MANDLTKFTVTASLGLSLVTWGGCSQEDVPGAHESDGSENTTDSSTDANESQESGSEVSGSNTGEHTADSTPSGDSTDASDAESTSEAESTGESATSEENSTSSSEEETSTERCTVFVRPDGDSSASGKSWQSALDRVQAAIDLANVEHCDVWVAAGTYYEHIAMADDVDIIGGFAGDETAIEQHDPQAYPTILDGEETGTVVVGAAATLDGMTITHGWSMSDGGGMVIDGGSGTPAAEIRNCSFVANEATRGGALAIHNATVHIENTRFFDNHARDGEETVASGEGIGGSGGALLLTGNAKIEVTTSQFEARCHCHWQASQCARPRLHV
jgi:hypothetical protein